jgi:hypothetical protein
MERVNHQSGGSSLEIGKKVDQIEITHPPMTTTLFLTAKACGVLRPPLRWKFATVHSPTEQSSRTLATSIVSK